MGAYPNTSRQNQALTPPRAHGDGIGEVAVIPVSGAAGAISLAALFPPATPGPGQMQTVQLQGVVGNFITLYADGADVGVIFGQTLALVSGGNAPVLATAGTVTTNVYAGAAGVCYRIPNGQERRYLVQKGWDLFLGFVGSAAGNLRVFQSSAPGIGEN